MTPERWQMVSTVLRGALGRRGGERAAYLDAACAGDAALRREVESLIAAGERAEGQDFLGSPAAVEFAGLFGELPPQLAAGQTVNQYVVEEMLGAGGMGESTARATPSSGARSR